MPSRQPAHQQSAPEDGEGDERHHDRPRVLAGGGTHPQLRGGAGRLRDVRLEVSFPIIYEPMNMKNPATNTQLLRINRVSGPGNNSVVPRKIL